MSRSEPVVPFSARRHRVVAALATGGVIACGGGAAAVPAPSPAPVAVVVPVAEDSGATSSPVAVEPPTEGPPSAPASVAGDSDAERIENAPRHRSKVLDGPPRPSKLAPGTYACRIDAMYRFRACTVRKDEKGFTWIDMPESLLGLTAVVYDDGASIVLDGTSATPRPFGCFACQERCTTDPASCVCKELMPAASRECLLQPLTGKLTKSGAIWRGNIRHVAYFNHYEGPGTDRHVTSWDKTARSFLVEIAPASALAPKPADCKKTQCI